MGAVDAFFGIFMWIGLGAAAVILVVLFGTGFARRDTSVSRWRDPYWLMWLGAVLYMLHNVEEYGIDLTGAHLAFVSLMSGMFGGGISTWAFLGCNIPLVWVAGPLIAWIGWRRELPGMASGMALFELVNGVSHVAQAALWGMYNPGLLTGVALFVPFAAWVAHVLYGKDGLRWGHFWATLGAGLLYHVILMAGVQLATHGILLGFPQFVYMTADAALLVLLVWLASRSGLGTRSR